MANPRIAILYPHLHRHLFIICPVYAFIEQKLVFANYIISSGHNLTNNLI